MEAAHMQRSGVFGSAGAASELCPAGDTRLGLGVEVGEPALVCPSRWRLFYHGVEGKTD